MPIIGSEGAASSQGFGQFARTAVATYIEDVFSTFLYTGNGSTQTINNGIDLAGKGGLVWIKKRDVAAFHILSDTARGVYNYLKSNTTEAEINNTGYITSYNSNGFSIGGGGNINYDNLVSWTFRKAPKFFDVVTYTGNSVAGRQISHALGSVPGCIIIKRTDTTSDWAVYHRGLTALAAERWIKLNTTAAETGADSPWSDTAPTSTNFTVNASAPVNASGGTYVAYLFAHNAGGFGLTGTDNVISCGSFTTDASGNATVDLGYEPQWVMIKRTNSVSGWNMYDNMRGWSNGGDDQYLQANSSAAEQTFNIGHPTATGMYLAGNSADSTYIYIAIRRGPMRTPTTGTSVYFPQAYADGSLGSENPTNLGASAGFPVDMFMHSMREETTFCSNIFDRLRGSNPALITSGTDAESTGEPLNAFQNAFDIMSGIKSRNNNRFYFASAIGRNHIAWNFRRAPGFFDVVCATTDGSGVFTGTHNLGVAPELIITKPRNAVDSWWVYAGSVNRYLLLNSTAAEVTSTGVWGAAPTSTTFTMINGVGVATQVAYLFASCPGVSKVFNYTGNGSSQTINCGFTGGARFVMVKRTDSTGNWMVVDTARGLVSAGDPTLYLNSTAAEVTGVDWIDPDSSGFIVNQEGTMNANVNGATYIGLAVA